MSACGMLCLQIELWSISTWNVYMKEVPLADTKNACAVFYQTASHATELQRTCEHEARGAP